MVTILVGEELTVDPKEQVFSNFVPDYIYKNHFNKGMIVKFYAEDVGITKQILVFIVKNATAEVKIVTMNPSIVKGLRKSKNLTIKKADDFEDVAGSPFEVTKAILTCRDRNYLLEFMVQRKESLYMPIRIMTSSYDQLTEHNKKMTMLLDKFYGKASNEILYYLIAHNMEVQKSFWSKWRFPPKKKEKESEDADD